jgi:hypothetical protein
MSETASYSYTVTEYEPERPWVVRSTSRGSVELPQDTHFYDWACERWPGPRFGVKLDSPPLSPWSF